MINVRDHGAKGDGSTDDTAAVKAAIQAAKSNRTGNTPGATVYFPPGAYRTTSTIDLSGISALHLLGANSGSGWAGYLGRVPQTMINGTAIKSGPVIKLSSPADGAGSGGYSTLQNLNIYGGDVAVLITDTANHLLKNCSMFVNPGGTTDNVPLVIENAFWVRWEDGSATAIKGKPAVILRGKSPHVNVNVTYLIEFRKIIFANGAVVYQQNTGMTGQLPEHFYFDFVQTEELPAGTPLFDITKRNSATAWLGLFRILMNNCNTYDPAGAAPLIRLHSSLGAADHVASITLINCETAGHVAVQQQSGSALGVNAMCPAGARWASTGATIAKPTGNVALVSAKDNGFDIWDLLQSTEATKWVDNAGAAVRLGKAGETNFRAGIDGTGLFYWGPGGSTGGWDTHLQRIAPGVLGMPRSNAFNVPVVARDPASPLNGMIWYNSTTQTLKCCVNGVVKTFAVT